MSPGREWRPTPGRRPPWWPEGEPFPPERWGRRGYGPPPFIRWIGCFVVSAFVVALLAGGLAGAVFGRGGGGFFPFFLFPVLLIILISRAVLCGGRRMTRPRRKPIEAALPVASG